MKVLIWGISIFCSGFLLHLIIWRVKLPEYQTKALLKLFLLLLFVWFVACRILNEYNVFNGLYLPVENFEFVHIFIFVWVLVTAYIAFYSLLEVDSPSLLITQAIANAGPQGLNKSALESLLSDQVLVIPRVNDLIHDQMAVLENGYYRIAPKGIFMLRIIFWYRRLLGASIKGG